MHCHLLIFDIGSSISSVCMSIIKKHFFLILVTSPAPKSAEKCSKHRKCKRKLKIILLRSNLFLMSLILIMLCIYTESNWYFFRLKFVLRAIITVFRFSIFNMRNKKHTIYYVNLVDLQILNFKAKKTVI